MLKTPKNEAESIQKNLMSLSHALVDPKNSIKVYNHKQIVANGILAFIARPRKSAKLLWYEQEKERQTKIRRKREEARKNDDPDDPFVTTLGNYEWRDYLEDPEEDRRAYEGWKPRWPSRAELKDYLISIRWEIKSSKIIDETLEELGLKKIIRRKPGPQT